MPLRAVVFDLFDTLVDVHMEGLPLVTLNGRTFPSTAGVLHAEVAQHAPVTLEEFAAAQRAVIEEVMQPRHAAGREFPTRERFDFVLARLGLAHPELAERLTSLHMGLLVGQVRHLAHHGDVLARLRARGVKLAVCSNFSHSQTALAILESARLRWHFDAILVSDAVGFLKPRPEIFRATLGALGSAPEETLHVGDSLSADIGGAAALGMRTAWITRRVAKTEEALAKHAGPKPDHVVSDLAEIADIAERG
ncbi:MAG: HAD family hydrolase [Deltaproteobacteria bacterium]|nr:HAD family hydrolase [Deltaproteobacteria bacterium]